MLTKEHIEAFFTYHSPGNSSEIAKYTAIREYAKQLALVIIEHTPPSADQTDAIRKLRECVMTANAAIACTPHLPTREPPLSPIRRLEFSIHQEADRITFQAHYDRKLLWKEELRWGHIVALVSPKQALYGFVEAVQQCVMELHGAHVDRDQIWEKLAQVSGEMAEKFRMKE